MFSSQSSFEQWFNAPFDIKEDVVVTEEETLLIINRFVMNGLIYAIVSLLHFNLMMFTFSFLKVAQGAPPFSLSSGQITSRRTTP